MKRTLLLAALITTLSAGCSSEQPATYSKQEMACFEWSGFASHQYSRYLEGDLQDGDLTRWADAALNAESQVPVIIVEASIPIVASQRKLSLNTGVWAIGNSVRMSCMEQKWSPMASK